jgi:fucose permease
VASHNAQCFSVIRWKLARDSSRDASLLVTGKARTASKNNKAAIECSAATGDKQMSNASNVINVRSLIDDRPINRFQWLVVFFGFCIIAADGFDVAIMGFIAPELKRLWHVSNPQLAPVLSAALAGLTLGALFAGPLADYLGRKVVLVLSVFFFGFWTLVTATSTDITHLVIFRFLTGLGLGAAMPNVGTLVSEFARSAVAPSWLPWCSAALPWAQPVVVSCRPG